MSVRDFSLSYTANPVLIWVNNQEGMVGPVSTINAQILQIDDVGPSTTTFYIPSSSVASVGPSSSVSGITPVQFIFGTNIIHYNKEALIKTNEINMQDVSILSDLRNAVWTAENIRRDILDVSSDINLDKSRSSALIVNTSASTPSEIKLPSSVENGLHYDFVATSNNNMKIFTEDSSIIVNGVVATGILLDSIGQKVSLITLNNGWIATKQFGNITSIENSIEPSGISGLSLHLDASVASSITVTSAPSVDQWDDLSGGGNHVSQSVAANKPSTGVSTINGLNAILWDGNANDALDNTTAGGTFTSASGDFFWVIKPVENGIFRYFFSSADTGASSDYMWFGVTATSNKLSAGAVASAVALSNTLSVGNLNNANVEILRITSTGSNYIFSLDGNLIGVTPTPGPDNGDWFADVPNRDVFTIGALQRQVGIQGAFEGSIAEVIYYDAKIITDDEASKLTTHLKNKWGI